MSLIAFIPAGQTNVVVNGLHQWDYGQTLEIRDETLPALIEVHFACSGMKEAVVKSCHTTGGVAIVDIPDQCLEQTTPVTVWIYEIGETAGTTIKTITLPIVARVKPPMLSLPQTASDKYTEAVAAMNAIVEKFRNGEIIVDRAVYAQNAEENTARIIALEIQNQGYAQSFEGMAQTVQSLIDRVTALENNSGGTGGGGTGGGSTTVSVIITNNSSVPLTGTYAKTVGSTSTFDVAVSGSTILHVIKNTSVYLRANDGRDASLSPSIIAVESNSYGYGTSTTGSYFFVVNGDGNISICDKTSSTPTTLTLSVDYTGGNASLSWNYIFCATKYKVVVGDAESGDTYEVTSRSYTVKPEMVSYGSSKQCFVTAYDAAGNKIATSNNIFLDTAKMAVTASVSIYNNSGEVARVTFINGEGNQTTEFIRVSNSEIDYGATSITVWKGTTLTVASSRSDTEYGASYYIGVGQCSYSYTTSSDQKKYFDINGDGTIKLVDVKG